MLKITSKILIVPHTLRPFRPSSMLNFERDGVKFLSRDTSEKERSLNTVIQAVTVTPTAEPTAAPLCKSEFDVDIC